MTGPPSVLRFRELLARRLGWTFADNDTAHLEQILADRAAAHAMNRVDYLTRLAGTGWATEIDELAERLSITETYFFRHAEQFRTLQKEVLPERLRTKVTGRVLRMLSVGCSSGEEAYTLAMVGRQTCPRPEWTVSVLGVDANPTTLARAERAEYSPWSLRDTPNEERRRWFQPCGDGFRVRDEIRSLVRFLRYNVVDDNPVLWHAQQYDVIFCRNLLMYLTPDATGTLVRRMTDALLPGGCLFLGHTDSLGARPEGLELRQSGQTFYYLRPTRLAPAPRPNPPVRPDERTPEPTSDAFDAAVALLHAERFADALALVTERLPGHPGPREALLHGVLLAQTGRISEAGEVARRLTDGDALYADAHQLLGLCHEADHAIDDAMAQYRLAAYLDPGFALPRLRLGQLVRQRGDGRAAATQLAEALALLPREDEDRITLFGGGFGRLALVALCRAELDTCEVRR